MIARRIRVLLLAAVLTAAGIATATDLPPLDALVGRISMALGGPNGGLKTLNAAPALELVFRRTVRASHSATEITADHRYVEIGDKQRIDVRVVDGKGKDSASVVDETAWLIVDDEAHDAEPSSVRAQLGEFDPRRLWSVPLALAAEGRSILQAASLEVTGREKDDSGGELLVMVGKNEDGEQTSRLVVDAKTYRPTNVQFVSSSGDVEYRYSDYRQVADGLVVPFTREFFRNGKRVSRTEVVSLKLKAPQDEPSLFDRSVTKLGAVSSPKGNK